MSTPTIAKNAERRTLRERRAWRRHKAEHFPQQPPGRSQQQRNAPKPSEISPWGSHGGNPKTCAKMAAVNKDLPSSAQQLDVSHAFVYNSLWMSVPWEHTVDPIQRTIASHRKSSVCGRIRPHTQTPTTLPTQSARSTLGSAFCTQTEARINENRAWAAVLWVRKEASFM